MVINAPSVCAITLACNKLNNRNMPLLLSGPHSPRNVHDEKKNHENNNNLFSCGLLNFKTKDVNKIYYACCRVSTVI